MKITYAPEPNPELFTKLLGILDYCHAPTKAVKQGMNDSAIMRALGISRRTMYKMRDQGDSWPWWPVVMQAAITEILPHLPTWKRRVVAKMMRTLPEEIVNQVEFACEARDYIIDQLKDGPALSSELLSPANRGPISEYRVKKAAKAMGVIKSREGKGKDHGSTWSLPRYVD